LGSQVSGVVETKVWTADKQPVALLAKKGLDSSSNSAASDKGHAGALYSKNSDPAAEVGMTLFTTALGLYGGVLCSGELQGFIISSSAGMLPDVSDMRQKSAVRANPAALL
jgi:hypothetical protein